MTVVERHVSAWAHVEHGIGMHVYTPAQRDAPTNMINNAICVGAVHKLRFAQDLILYNLEVSDQVEGFDGSAHKDVWQNDPIWQGVRENVEKLTGIRDWAQAFFATAVVFEPLVGELFRSEFVMHAAALQGDFVTPAIMGCGESDCAREQRGARALFRMLADDEEHGAHNREVMQGWLDEWVPVSLAAAQQLQPIWSEISEKVVRFEDSLDASKQRSQRPAGRHHPRDPQGGPLMSQFESNRSSSNECGVTLMNNQVGYVVAKVMEDKKDVTMRVLPSMIRVDGIGTIDFDFEEIAEALGWEDFGNDDFEEIMSTHYGRMVVLDDRILMFANPEDAAEYIGFDLQPVEG